MFALANSMLPGNPTELREDLAVRVASCETASARDSSWDRLALVDWTRSLMCRGSKKENRLGTLSLETFSGIGEGFTYIACHNQSKLVSMYVWGGAQEGNRTNHDHRRHFFQGHVGRDALQINCVHVVHSRLQVHPNLT